MRLIDADAFKKVLSEHEMKHDKRRSFDDYDCGAANAYEHAIDLLDEMPTVERPHGEWIAFEWNDNYSKKIPLPKGSDSHMEEYWDEEFMCSVCGKAHHARNFCPNCGADMREEGDPD